MKDKRKKKRLKGDALDIAEMNRLYLGAADPDTPNISPGELKKIWEEAKPKQFKSLKVGIPIIFGTGGDID